MNKYRLLGIFVITLAVLGLVVMTLSRFWEKESDDFDFVSMSEILANHAQSGVLLGAASAVRAKPVEETPYIPDWVSSVDFDSLRLLYPDIVGWIKIEGTVIDYPLVQGEDNDFYLHSTPEGLPSQDGSIYLDFRNSADFSDKNALIYGHHMRDGSMFAALEMYKRQTFYDEHPCVTIYTPKADIVLELVSAYVVSADNESVPLRFVDDAQFMSYVDDIRERSLFNSDVEVTTGDSLVSLCTCTYNFNNARLIVVGKLTK